jgi:hypothetical protein
MVKMFFSAFGGDSLDFERGVEFALLLVQMRGSATKLRGIIHKGNRQHVEGHAEMLGWHVKFKRDVDGYLWFEMERKRPGLNNANHLGP